MRLPTVPLPLMRTTALLFLFAASVYATSQEIASREIPRDMPHESPEWAAVASHLPDPNTATIAQLELAGDVLRARRFTEDARVYYQHALRRGGNEARIMNKLGVTELELGNVPLARVYFQRVVKVQKANADGWNNLGAIEYLQRRYNAAINDYKRAVKQEPTFAVYHSNLGTAYFGERDFTSAREQYAKALKLDPMVFERTSVGGVSTHLLSTEDRALFCFEMARLYAGQKDDANVIHWLTKASESGYDIRDGIRADAAMAAYRTDPRIAVLIANAKSLRSHGATVNTAGTVPALPAESSTPKIE